MRKIKDVLSQEIFNGIINWEKLENKIHAAIPLLKEKYTANTAEGKPFKATLEDALTFPVIIEGEKKCYKIFKPRFTNGNLYCAGLQCGVYDMISGKPIFIAFPEMF